MLCWIKWRTKDVAVVLISALKRLEPSPPYLCKYIMPMLADMIATRSLETRVVDELAAILNHSVERIVNERELTKRASEWRPGNVEETVHIQAPVQVAQLDIKEKRTGLDLHANDHQLFGRRAGQPIPSSGHSSSTTSIPMSAGKDDTSGSFLSGPTHSGSPAPAPVPPHSPTLPTHAPTPSYVPASPAPVVVPRNPPVSRAAHLSVPASNSATSSVPAAPEARPPSMFSGMKVGAVTKRSSVK